MELGGGGGEEVDVCWEKRSETKKQKQKEDKYKNAWYG
jgi:hypothetical protein